MKKKCLDSTNFKLAELMLKQDVEYFSTFGFKGQKPGLIKLSKWLTNM